MSLIFWARPAKPLCISFFILELSDWIFYFLFFIYLFTYLFILFYFILFFWGGRELYGEKSLLWLIDLTFIRKLLLCRTITSNVNKVRMQKFHSGLFFFLHFLLQVYKTVWEGRGKSLFPSSISTHSQTFRHLFVVLHIRWQPFIINHRVHNCYALAQWDLPTSWN